MTKTNIKRGSEISFLTCKIYVKKMNLKSNHMVKLDNSDIEWITVMMAS